MVIQVSFDKENSGIYCIKQKKSFQLCLWFVAVRIFFMPERTLQQVIYLVVKEDIENR